MANASVTEPQKNQKYAVIERSDSEANLVGDVLPLWRKLCFAVGGAPYQVTSTVIGFFLNIFLLEVALMQPRYVSIILFSGKAWDAITDPSIGVLVQKTNTRWGKMRPWILFSAPLACTCYFLLFYIPWDITTNDKGSNVVDASDSSKLGFYFAAYCLFQGFLTCLHVPYTAMTMYITTQQKERDAITFIRMAFEASGVLLAVVVQGLFVGDTRCKGDEQHTNGTSLEVQKEAYFHSSMVVVSLYMLCCLTVFFGTKEKKGFIEENKEHTLGFFTGMKTVFTFKPYLWASLTFLFLTIAIQIVQGNIALYCTHALKEGEDFSKFVFVLLIISIVSMPLWHFVSQRFGKKNAYATGMVLFIPLLFAQLYLPSKSKIIYYFVNAIAGLCISVSFLLPWSVLPDVLDLYMLEKGLRHDALFYSFYVFFNKLASGVALAVSQLALEFGGYISGECQQPDSVGDTLRYLIAPGPVILMLMALFCLYMYPIDEKKRIWIKEQITNKTIEVDNKSLRSVDVSQSYESFKPVTDTFM
ncbi:sodium-dependent lysophosphatidylcholine symporter 1-B [Biomphalaria glabrata]|uniref:Sodium-dependent lysophosphatidylcholine symporter 1-B-like isoform X1 n=2 Tax=Biomphalaria glabrata TaxID=6526 RepID=A0A9W3AAZ8_BIOGL|nr:sodium-dependent lysophosphatidylcholine symporter 1-B-like isoform X1 [Biomphalaria glabrata]XP_055884330.1 sodium-dependent lysophosphatidylcholine symporter 1-B-like isoform X1 [Biomphalaria glabrata]KAI8754240.1 sodium-dependent lysophosphatidylcholine symporter 1-B-like [Biomphalaria glabrata]KAI8774071.1 sodium-dependent lysophosphatidylcholine symporter 1-B [Biomphalaria glabrata]